MGNYENGKRLLESTSSLFPGIKTKDVILITLISIVLSTVITLPFVFSFNLEWFWGLLIIGVLVVFPLWLIIYIFLFKRDILGKCRWDLWILNATVSNSEKNVTENVNKEDNITPKVEISEDTRTLLDKIISNELDGDKNV